MAGFQVEGDLALSADESDVVLAAGAAAVEQQIRTGATVWQGYWVFDPSVGLPMLTDILGKGRDLRAITAIFRSWLAGIPGVVSVERCDCVFDRAARALSVLFAVTCENGETLASEVTFAVA